MWKRYSLEVAVCCLGVPNSQAFCQPGNEARRSCGLAYRSVDNGLRLGINGIWTCIKSDAVRMTSIPVAMTSPISSSPGIQPVPSWDDQTLSPTVYGELLLLQGIGEPLLLQGIGEPLLLQGIGELLLLQGIGEPLLLQGIGEPLLLQGIGELLLLQGIGEPLLLQGIGELLLLQGIGELLLLQGIGEPLVLQGIGELLLLQGIGELLLLQGIGELLLLQWSVVITPDVIVTKGPLCVSKSHSNSCYKSEVTGKQGICVEERMCTCITECMTSTRKSHFWCCMTACRMCTCTYPWLTHGRRMMLIRLPCAHARIHDLHTEDAWCWYDYPVHMHVSMTYTWKTHDVDTTTLCTCTYPWLTHGRRMMLIRLPCAHARIHDLHMEDAWCWYDYPVHMWRTHIHMHTHTGCSRHDTNVQVQPSWIRRSRSLPRDRPEQIWFWELPFLCWQLCLHCAQGVCVCVCLSVCVCGDLLCPLLGFVKYHWVN